MKLLLLSLFMTSTVFAQSSFDLKCQSKTTKDYILDLRVGIVETSIDQYEIDLMTTELMVNSEDDLLQLVEVKETDKGWKSLLLKFDAFNGVEINYKRDYFIELIATDSGYEVNFSIEDDNWNDTDILECDEELDHLFGYIAF
jgi:hypothetical protein